MDNYSFRTSLSLDIPPASQCFFELCLRGRGIRLGMIVHILRGQLPPDPPIRLEAIEALRGVSFVVSLEELSMQPWKLFVRATTPLRPSE